MNFFIRLTKMTSFIVVITAMSAGIFYQVGIRLNVTESIPLGIYRTTNTIIERGSYVLFCPPKENIFDEAKRRGYLAFGVCPGDYGYMMKRVFAVSEDIVQINESGVKWTPLSRQIF